MYKPSQFLIRPRPLAGESLSSWRQRSAWRNGYVLFPVSSEKLRRVDPDVGLHETELEWLANGHNVDPSSLVPLTLAGQQNGVIRHLSSHSQPSWWLRSRVAGAKEKAGPMFCPICLKNDDKPFFRLYWRFGFVASCPIHEVEMLDRCPTCGEAAWPGGAGMSSRLSSTFSAFNQCWACSSDLSRTGSAPTGAAIDALLLKAVCERTLTLGGTEFPTVEVLEALRAICHLFIRNRTRQLIHKSQSEWCDVLLRLSPDCEDNRTIELMGVSDRRLLVGTAWTVISNWPASFREFCNECGFQKWHFDGASQLSPVWMNHEVAATLAKQNRSVTRAVLSQTFESMKESLGRPPRKCELRQKLVWRGSRFIGDLYPQRSHATEQEVDRLLLNAKLELQRRSTRRQSMFHAAVDIAVIVICLLDRRNLDAVHTQNAHELDLRLAALGASNVPNIIDLLSVLRDTLRTYPIARKIAYVPKIRQIKKRFSSLLHNAPMDLVGSVDAYWIY